MENLREKDETIDFLIKEASNDIEIKEVVEKNKNKILKQLPIENYDDFDYELFENILIKVIEKHVEKEQTEVINEENCMEVLGYDPELSESDNEFMDSLDYTIDTGVQYTTEDNSFQANYQNFIDDAIENMNHVEEPEIGYEAYYSPDIDDVYYDDLDPVDYMDIPQDWYFVNINTLKGVLREYDEQKELLDHGVSPII